MYLGYWRSGAYVIRVVRTKRTRNDIYNTWHGIPTLVQVVTRRLERRANGSCIYF